MSQAQPAPKHLGFFIRMCYNAHHGLDPLAGFDDEDMRQMDEINRGLSEAMSQVETTLAQFGKAAEEAGKTLRELDAMADREP